MKKLPAMIMAFTVLCFTGCGAAEQSSPAPTETTPVSSEASEQTSVDEAITEIAQIATDRFEQPEMLAMREAYLTAFKDTDAPAPIIDQVVEVSHPENNGHISTHIYIINVNALFLSTKDNETMINDNITMVYDCDTGELYDTTDPKYFNGVEPFEEYSKDYNICLALYTNLPAVVAGEQFVYSNMETDIIFSSDQLQAINDLFHPSGWESQTAADITAADQGDISASESDVSASESDVSAGDSADLCRIAIDTLKAGLADDSFAKGELIDHTILAAAEYTILFDDTENSKLHLLYIWLNGNKENGNDYAGQVLIDVDTGMTLYSSDYDESKIGFDHMDDLKGDDWLYYYFWMGTTACSYDGSTYLMNETEVLTPLSDSQISEIQAGI